MSFIAKLFINGRVINVLDTNIQLYQQTDHITLKPRSIPKGGLFTITIEADGATDLILQAVSPDTMTQGFIRFYRRDGMSKLTDYEFFDTYITYYKRYFKAFNGEPATDTFTFSPGILRIGDMVLQKWWKVTDLAAQDTNIQAAPPTEEKTPQMTETYYEDKDGNRLTSKDLKIGDEFTLVLKTIDGVGKTVTIDFADNNKDFEYKGKVLDGDLLEGIKIRSNTQKFRLKVVAPKK